MKKYLLATSSVVAFCAFAGSVQANEHALSSMFFKPNQGQTTAAYDLGYNSLSYEVSGTGTTQYVATNNINLAFGLNDKVTVDLAGKYNDDSDNGNGWSNPSISLSYRASEGAGGIFDITASYSPDMVDSDSSNYVGDDDDFADIDAPEANRYSVGIRLGHNEGVVRRAVSVAYEYSEDYIIGSTGYSSESNIRLSYESQYLINDELTLDTNVGYLVRDQRTRGTTDVDGGDKLSVGVGISHQVQDDLVLRVNLERSDYSNVDGSSNTITDSSNTAVSAGIKYLF
jgi:hypothetical protein